ncbi:hypothetical protein MKY37_21800 [Psychrobacillus sp. FSL K6-2836]|uniref:hypothetical protein n=1 Tax=Psychrobacillus sp. FSL K6-2836 TaxID=2921548 RepID=UPI0030F7F107
MVLRTVANKVGTIEVSGNTISYLQPLSTFNTQEMDLIEKRYREKMNLLQGHPQVVPAKDINFQSGQVCYAYDVTGYKSFNSLKTMYLEDKLPYYLSLIELAKNKEIKVLWNAQNLLIDEENQLVKVMVIENDALDIVNDTSILNIVKELIVISLTNLEQVFGRPKRSDFFEQREEVIQFTEMIYLRLNSLHQIKEYIEVMNEEVQERKRQEQAEFEKRMANNKVASFLQRTPFKIARTNNTDQRRIVSLDNNHTKKPMVVGKSRGNNKRFLLGTVGIVIIAIVLNLVLTNANKSALSTNQSVSSASGETNMEPLYVQALLGESKELMDRLSKNEYDSLSEDHQNLLTQLWLEQGEYQKLLEQDEKAVSLITEYLTNQNKTKELDRLQELIKVDNPHIAFAKGVLAKDPETVINNRNLVELTDERKTHVVNALLQTGEVEKAKMFVSEKAPENDGLMDTVIAAEKNAVELKALEEQQVLLQKTIDESEDQLKVSEAKQKINEVNKKINELKK